MTHEPSTIIVTISDVASEGITNEEKTKLSHAPIIALQ